ncbi:MAG: hypothetical protein H0U49_07985 [Parachlamydiaceae bacterium]|nr:hypothetical protein [Parachlamydiaceae bacterium]
MIQHFSAIAIQIQTDFYSLFESKIPYPPLPSLVTRPDLNKSDEHADHLEKSSVYLGHLSKKTSVELGRYSRIFYAQERLMCATVMTSALLCGLKDLLITFSLPSVAVSTGVFVISHDIFQILKNRQELEQNQLSTLKAVATLGKGVFSGGKALFKSVWEGKSDHEIGMNTFRAAFNKAASLQSKNTFLKPLWNEFQFQLAIREYNPFPGNFKNLEAKST